MTFDKNDFTEIKTDNNSPPEIWVIANRIVEKFIKEEFIEKDNIALQQAISHLIIKEIVDGLLLDKTRRER